MPVKYKLLLEQAAVCNIIDSRDTCNWTFGLFTAVPRVSSSSAYDMWGAAIWCTLEILDTEHHPASSWTPGSVSIVHGERENIDIETGC